MAEKPDQNHTRTLILERARELFLSQGYHKTAMRTIAEAAGISTGPLYFHFRNKAEVFFHICSDAFGYLIEDFRRAAGQEIHAGLRLRAIYYAYKNFYYKEPQLFEIMHLGANPQSGVELPPSMEEILNRQSHELLQVMEGTIRDGIARGELRSVDPCRLALYLFSVSEGIFLSNRMGMLQRSEVSLDEMIETAIDLIGMGMIEQHGECPAAGEDIRTIHEKFGHF